MSEKKQIVRQCKDCPKWTQIVCHHAFGVYWCIKSGGGKGCSYPLDDVAEAWHKGGWTPGNGETVPITLPIRDTPKPIPPRKKVYVQFDLMPTAELPPLSDDDY